MAHNIIVTMLLLNKSRIQRMPKQLSALPEGTEIRLAIKANEAHCVRPHQEIGLLNLPQEGDTVLPTIVGAATRKNAEGYFILHKDLPKERRMFTIASRRSQFCGRDQREIVEDYHSYSRMCWQRTFVEPTGIEITYLKGDDEDSYYVSPTYKTGQDDELIFSAINVFLDLFKICHVCDLKNGGFPSVPVRRVNWQLLRPGAVGSREALEQLVDSIPRPVQKKLARRQFNILHQYDPAEMAVGQGGFHGYVAFHFSKVGLTILESIEPNNATYVFGNDWQKLSQLTKQEVLSDQLQIDRIFHNDSWQIRVERLLKVRKSA